MSHPSSNLISRLEDICGNGPECKCTAQDAIRELERLRAGIWKWAGECASCDGTGESADEFGKPCDACADIRALLTEEPGS